MLGTMRTVAEEGVGALWKGSRREYRQVLFGELRSACSSGEVSWRKSRRGRAAAHEDRGGSHDGWFGDHGGVTDGSSKVRVTGGNFRWGRRKSTRAR